MGVKFQPLVKSGFTIEKASGSGDITGPSSSTANHIPQFSDTTGKVLKDGLGLVTTVGSPGSDTNIPSEKAVRGAISASGGGDVSGPASSTDNNIAVFDSTSGKLIKDGGKTILAIESGIPTALSALSDDSTHRLTTDTEKSTWNGKQNALNGTGFVKASGTTISYDNSTYLTSLNGAVLTDQTTPQTIINGVPSITNGLLVGSDANLTDFPLAKLVSSHDNTGHTYTGTIGVVGEANATAGDTGTGVGGVAKTNGNNQGRGVSGVGKVSTTGDGGAAIGVYGRAEDTHAGGRNIGLYGYAGNSSVGNHALYLNGGDIYTPQSQSWTVLDNYSNALRINSTGKADLLNIDTTDSAEKVTMSGGLTVTGTMNNTALTASKLVFTDSSKNLTSTGIGTSSQFIKGDGSLDSSTYLTSSDISGKENTSNKATDFTTINNTLYPTVEAVSNAINTAVTGLLDYRGSYDASTNLFPATGGSGLAGAILKGDFWVCSVAGTLGGVSVTAGDLIIAINDTPGQTASNWDLVENTLGYTPENVANKKTDLTDNSDTYYPSQKAVKTVVDAKVTANAGISGATKTKITYDAKGLVTGGADASTADIADSSNKRYVTDAQLTVIGNTSGTNSGDNATNTQYSGLATSKLSLDQTTSQSIINGQPIQDTLTASEIVATDASKKLQTLAVATYPSLTELSYVKGVTSGIQTQLNAKGTGTVTSIGVTTANGVSGSSSGGATPSLTIALGAITPTTVNALTLSQQTVGFTIAGGGTSKTLTVPLDASVSGTNTGDQTLPVKSSAAETDAATDDTKFVTSLTARKFTAAPASDHLASGIKVVLNANENQTFGDVCFINADGQAQLGDADAIATSSCIAMCADAAISANADGNYLLFGFARDDSWAWTVGGTIYLTVTGTSGNTLSQTAPSGTDDVIQIIGVATHADRLYFNPQLVQVEHT